MNDQWWKWDGHYVNQFYDVWPCDDPYNICLVCYPIDDKMVALDSSKRSWTPDDQIYIRVSEFQAEPPKYPSEKDQ